jgi:hypothetical protein
MAIAPLQPHSSWYRRFWYAERSPLDTLIDRMLIFGILALLLVAGTTRLMHRDGDAASGHRQSFTEAAH